MIFQLFPVTKLTELRIVQYHLLGMSNDSMHQHASRGKDQKTIIPTVLLTDNDCLANSVKCHVPYTHHIRKSLHHDLRHKKDSNLYLETWK